MNGTNDTDARTASPQTLLRSAARLVEKAQMQLDTKQTPCKECGRPHSSNVVHFNVNQSLEGQATKLRNAADKLDGK